jgi:putative inorganic carbon (HCO3(-)) transporter
MAKAGWQGEDGMTVRLPLRKVLDWLADWQIIPVGLLSPAFMLADRLPHGLVVLAVLAVPALWGVYRVARGRFFNPTPVDVPLVILITTLPIGVWAAAVPALALPFLLQYLFALALFYALVNSLNSDRRVILAGWMTLLGTALLAGLGLAGTAWGDGSKFLPGNWTRFLPNVLEPFWYSSGFNPNIVGGALAVLIPITAAYAWTARRWSGRLLLGLLFVGETLTLVLTQSRGGFLGLGFALVVLAIGRDRRWGWILPILAILGVAGTALFGLQPATELVMDRVANGALPSAEGRLGLLSQGVEMLRDFPVTGVGLGMFPRVLMFLYPFGQLGPEVEIPHVHNVYLQMGIDHGLMGLVAFLAFLVLLWTMGSQALRWSRGLPWEPLTLGLFGGLAAYLIHGLFDAIWRTPRSHPIIWGCWGLLTAVWCWSRERRQAG